MLTRIDLDPSGPFLRCFSRMGRYGDFPHYVWRSGCLFVSRCAQNLLYHKSIEKNVFPNSMSWRPPYTVTCVQEYAFSMGCSGYLILVLSVQVRVSKTCTFILAYDLLPASSYIGLHIAAVFGGFSSFYYDYYYYYCRCLLSLSLFAYIHHIMQHFTQLEMIFIIW